MKPQIFSKLLVGFAFFTFSVSQSFSQLTVTNGYTATQLGNNLAGNNINIYNASITGNSQQYGQFQFIGNSLGLNSGVILSTGDIDDAVGPNSSGSTSSSMGGPGDPDLSALAGVSTNDAVVFEFDFEVQGDEIEFNFVFLSEEYNEFVNSGFNDVFAFYISGPGISGIQNIAVVPGTTTPVTINSINNGSFWQYFTDNTGNSVNIEFDGFTTLMTASKNGLTPCGIYTLSLRIADGSDSAYDSAVLLQENSLIQSNISASSNTFSANNTALEGCIEASFTFQLDSILPYDIDIPINIGGSATNGVDYAYIDNLITIPAGQLSATLIIDAIAEGITEGQEVVELYYSPSPCQPQDTVLLYIDDYSPLEYTVDPTNVTCFGANNGMVDLSVSGGIPPYTLTLTDSITGDVDSYTSFPVIGLSPGTYFVEVIDGYGCTAADIISGNIFDAGQTFIPDGQGGSYSSTIVLGGFGASQTIQSADQIQSICTTMEHSRIGELEITLTAPDGTVVILKEQPGGSVTNLGEPCAVGPTDGGNSNTDPGIGYNYCFQPISTFGTMVDESNSYTYQYVNVCDLSIQQDKYLPSGSYQPYESFDNFIGSPLNGGWTITVSDAIPNNNGYIFDWSITLQADLPDSVFTITEPAGPSISHTSVAPTCGGTNGSINLTITNGAPPFTYSWSNGATTQDINGLTAGVYTVVITDDSLCNFTYQVNLSNNGSLVLSGTASDETCLNANDGAVDLLISGGTSPFNFTWSNGATSEDLSNLSPGTYTVSVSDAASCLGVASFNIAVAPAINIIASITNENCGDAEGIIDITVYGANAPVVYSWSNGATTEDIDELIQGSYIVTLTDANNCNASDTFSVINLVGNCIPNCDLSFTSVLAADEICGNGDGSINLTIFTTNGPTAYSWSNGSISEDLNLLSSGTYSVTVSDNEGCIIDSTFTISNQTGNLTITAMNVTNESCGNGLGAVNASISGGSLPYAFNWSNGATTEDISGLSAGNYTLTVTDANGCSAYQTTSVSNITGGLTQTYGNAMDETCSNGQGSIDIQISGGQLPYSYIWSNGATTQDLTNLSAGTYSCVITDANSCSITTPSYLVENQSGSLAITSIDVDNEVCGNNLGEIELIVSGGSLPYTFNWNTGATSQDLFGLSAGTYSALVMDGSGCSVSTGNLVVLNESGTLAISSVTSFDEVCGNGLGSINLSVSGGSSPISYLWNTGSTSQDLTNLSEGYYTCTVSDISGCQVFANALINNNQGVMQIDNIIITDETCGDGSGALDLMISGASAPISYLWSNGAITEDISGLFAGTYSVIITDNNGCTTNGNAIVGNTTSSGFAITSAILTNEVCGNAAGGIDLIVSGGVLPISYLWSNGAITEDLNGVSAGTYSCTLSDNNGCSIAAGPYTITNSSGTLNVTLQSSTDETCSSNNGAINISVSGGSSPYTYNWSNGASTEDITNLSAGTYSVVVSDQNTCTDLLSVTLVNSSGSLLIGSVSITDELCGGLNGAINIEVSGGTLPYSYMWSNGASSQDITGLNDGTYSVTVTDAAGCSLSGGPYSVNPNSGNLSLSGINVVNEVCGDGMGNVDLIISGAAGSLVYNWSNGSTTQDLNMVSAGTYSGSATDVAGCTLTFSAVVLNESGTLTASANSTAATCNQSNGTIDLTVTGAGNPVIYLWSNGATTEDISNLNAGNYTCTITDANGCTINQLVAVADESGPVITGVSATNENCGNNDGSILINISGGAAPLIYNWSTPATTPCCNYTLNMQDQGNSWNGASVDVLVDGTLEGNYTVLSGGFNSEIFPVCDGQLIELVWNSGGFDNEVSFDLLDGDGNLVFSQGASPTPGTIFTGNASCSASSLDGPYETGLSAGTYVVVVTDANGCEDSVSVTLLNTSGNLQITATNLVDESCSDANGSIDISVNGTAPISYTWSNGASTQDLTNISAGNYDVVITDQNGCSLAATYSITNFSNGLGISSSLISNESCGNASGSIEINPVGGTGPLSFLWNNGYTAQNIYGLSAGTYTVTLMDGSICDYTETFTIGNDAGNLAIAAVLTDESCSLANGGIDQTVSGGLAPYSFLWSNYSTSEDLTNLVAGPYLCTITDANGCEYDTTYLLNGTNNNLSTTAVITDEDCGNGDGSINVSVSGGLAPYSYQWSNGSTTQDLNNLTYGNYTLTLTDANGCTSLNTFNVASSGNFLITDISITEETCTTGDGAINLTFGGFGQPQNYLWSNGATTQDISGLNTGWYTVEMSTTFGPGGGCTMVDSFYVGQNQSTLQIDSLVITNETCSMANGAIDAVISGGTAPYTYSWSNGSVNEDLTNLSAGTYTLSVSDLDGCSASTSYILNNYTFGFGLSSATVVDENCGDGTGQINIEISGGTAPYSYSWSNGQSTEDITGLSAGNYTLIVTDAVACIISNSFTVGNFTSGFAIDAVITPETCGNQNGEINLGVTGGVQPINFNWNTGDTSEDLLNIVGGNYTCIVSDATGCIINIVDTVPSFSAGFTMGSVQVTDESCGDGTGEIVLSPVGGTAPLTYLWETPNPCCEYTLNMYDLNNNGWGGTPIAEVLVYLNGNLYGNFTVPVGTGNSFNTVQIPVCTGDLLEFEYVEAAQNQNNTYEVLDSEGNIIFEDGPNPFNGVAFSTSAICSAGNTNILSGLHSGTYIVEVSDFYGCVINDTIYVDNITTGGLAINTIGLVNESCQASNGSIDITVIGGSSPYTYSWTNGSTSEDLNSISEGQYQLTVTDNTGCSVSAQYTITNTGSGVDLLNIVSSDATCSTCSEGSIDLTLGGSSAPYTFDWSNGATTEDISGLTPGTYSVTITNADGCDTTVVVEILNLASLTEIAGLFLEIYPNPSSGNFKISLLSTTIDELSFKIMDASGRILIAEDISFAGKTSFEIDMSKYEPATYLMNIQLEGQQFVYRLIRQ